MTSAKFERCHPKTAKWEGGWSNHKADPGGKTMYGVTEARYHEWLRVKGKPLQPVRRITMAEALQIYFEGYWQELGCERLFPGVDLAVYDAGVNSGPSRARKWLMAAVGSDNHAETVKRICQKRLGFVQSLKIWKTFGKGWGNRIADIQATGMAWAMEAMAMKPEAIRTDLEHEAAAKAETAKKQTGVGIGAGAGSATTGTGAVATGAGDGGAIPSVPGVDHVDQLGGAIPFDPAGLVLACVVLGLVAAVLLWRASINTAQRDAFQRTANKL